MVQPINQLMHLLSVLPFSWQSENQVEFPEDASTQLLALFNQFSKGLSMGSSIKMHQNSL